MHRDILSSLRALLSGGNADEVHFHSGPAGQPVVCEYHRCDRPHLAVH